MTFQTVFYIKATGKILHVLPNKYIRSKAEKVRLCPGYTADEVNFLYFPSRFPIDTVKHQVRYISPTVPPVVQELGGLPLVLTDKRQIFIDAKALYRTIIVELDDSMGDNLLRAAAIIEASRKYPEIKFYCKCWPQFRPIMELCPDITIFSDHKALGLDPKKCGTIVIPEGPLWDPRGPGFGKASLYGIYLDLPSVPYSTKLVLPAGFDQSFADFDQAIGLRKDGRNIVFQLRSKNWIDKCWPVDRIKELARWIKSSHDCTIFYLGSDIDIVGDHPEFVNLCGKTDWLQTVHLLRSAFKVVCVDSSVMHLCHALDIPCFRLWGKTTPDLILGEDPGPLDIIASPTGGQSFVGDITALQVFDVAFPKLCAPGELIFDPREDVSDFGGQEVIFKFFRDHPPVNSRLVDIGAHGKNSSNTYGLLKNGWQGLMIEANPDRVKICKRDFAGLNAKVLNIGVSDEAGHLPLYMHHVVGSSSFLADWDPHEHTGEKIMVKVVPVDKVFKTHQIPDDLDFLALDIEGLDCRVMKCIFEKTSCRPRLIVTEAASYEDPDGFFGKYGYEFLTKLKLDKYGNLFFFRK